MKKIYLIAILFLAVFMIAGCDMAAWPDFSGQSTDEEMNINEESGDWLDESMDVGSEKKLQDYTLVLGRSDVDIQSQKTYNFSLAEDVTFEVMGVDAPSTIIEFKKDGQAIFSWTNRDYAVDEDTFDLMYPEADWYNYSFTGGHTNVLFLDDENYEDDLFIFEDSLQINGDLVF